VSGALTGGLVNYYLAPVTHPQRTEQSPYVAECEDITAALQMTPEEFCEFKAIWRTAAARLGNGKPGNKALYDAEKRLHYAGRDVAKYRRELEESSADGWVKHSQNKMPFILRGDELVEVELKDGTKPPARAANEWAWNEASEMSVIVKWRRHNHVV
jgi:hypothetical protein